MKKLVSLLGIIVLLSGCHSMATPEAKQDKKVTAARINIQLGMAYLERHEVQRSKQKFILALHEAPQIPEVWYSMGYFFEVTGEPQRAQASYQKALDIAPKRGDVNNNFGTYLCRNHHYREAVKYFVRATEDPEYLDTAAAYENAGLCAELIPDNGLAMKYFEDALKQDPSRANTLLGMAEIKYKEKQYSASKELLKQYLAIGPETADSKALGEKLKGKA